MKKLSIKFFITENILTLWLSILVWVLLLICIYFLAATFVKDEKTVLTDKTIRVVRYYERATTASEPSVTAGSIISPSPAARGG